MYKNNSSSSERKSLISTLIDRILFHMMKSDDLSLPALRKNPEKNHPKNTTHLEIPPHVEGSQGRKVVC